MGKSSTFLIFPANFYQFYLFFLKLNLFFSSFWPSGWASRPTREGPGYATVFEMFSICQVVLVRGTPTAGVLIHWAIISRRWERIQQRDSESPINTDSPRKKSAAMQWLNREITGQKTHRTDTILPEHLLAHTLITYVYSHYCIWSFCHHFLCKNDVLITSTRIEFSNHENKQSLTQTFYLLLAAALSM